MSLVWSSLFVTQANKTQSAPDMQPQCKLVYYGSSLGEKEHFWQFPKNIFLPFIDTKLLTTYLENVILYKIVLDCKKGMIKYDLSWT